MNYLFVTGENEEKETNRLIDFDIIQMQDGLEFTFKIEFKFKVDVDVIIEMKYRISIILKCCMSCKKRK